MRNMSTCTCGTHKSEESEPVEEIKEAPEAAEALNEPVREEDLNKDEEEEEAEEEKSEEPKEKEDTLEKSLATLKKYGFNVYSGSKNTPAPKTIETPKAKYNFDDLVSKSWEELEALERGN